jgi:tRNA-splicing ligase RtcB (3'-phosphate/5'-hydroxy nucleic acid ligase)
MYRLHEDGMNVPAYIWAKEGSIETAAIEQLKAVSRLPFAFHHTVLCPDGHAGYGMPIGGVIACDGAVIPNAVGVDIGCGMMATKTTLRFDDLDLSVLPKIIASIQRDVPVGFNHHRDDQPWEGFDRAPDIPVVQKELASARKQLGTLGGGNHFIEIQAGDDGHVWLMLHSGSRNFGYKIAEEYNTLATKFCEMWHSSIPPVRGDDGLAFLPTETDAAQEYIAAMRYAMGFAQENRAQMMACVVREFGYYTGATSLETINIHHNFASLEHHFGRDVWVHRKGATQARKGQMGIIPGSMGISSYIVRGLGNADSFQSCSHGAGRATGRMEFSRTHTVEDCDKEMAGIVFGGWGKDRKGRPDLSEAPSAYKSIDDVIAAQTDLVEIVTKLTPLAVLKG